MIVVPNGCKKMLSEDTPTEKLNKPIKTYRYRLKLEVYEESPSIVLKNRFAIDTLSVFNNNEFINEALKNSFEQLLVKFNQENE